MNGITYSQCTSKQDVYNALKRLRDEVINVACTAQKIEDLAPILQWKNAQFHESFLAHTRPLFFFLIPKSIVSSNPDHYVSQMRLLIQAKANVNATALGSVENIDIVDVAVSRQAFGVLDLILSNQNFQITQEKLSVGIKN